MVLEQLLGKRAITRHAPYVFLLSILYVFIAFSVQYLFFPEQSVTMILLVTLLLAPSLHHLTNVEEKIERTGSKHFFSKHKTIIKCYFFAFLGTLAGFFILGTIASDALAYQTIMLEHEDISPSTLSRFEQFTPSLEIAAGLFTHNLSYLLIGFFLALFYGAGSVFLIVYNASFFAAFVLQILGRWEFFAYEGILQVGAIPFIHLVPESLAFIMTAIAGTTLSRAFLCEQLKSQAFKNVMQNSVLLLMSAIVLLATAALLEVFVTAPMLQRLFF